MQIAFWRRGFSATVWRGKSGQSALHYHTGTYEYLGTYHIESVTSVKPPTPQKSPEVPDVPSRMWHSHRPTTPHPWTSAYEITDCLYRGKKANPAQAFGAAEQRLAADGGSGSSRLTHGRQNSRRGLFDFVFCRLNFRQLPLY